MSVTRRQVAGIINTCETVISAGQEKYSPRVDATASTVAAVILEQAKAEYSNNKVLEAVKLGGADHLDGITSRHANGVHSTLPPPWDLADKSPSLTPSLE